MKTYKTLRVPPNLHKKIRTSASKKGITIIQFLKETLNYNINK